MPPDSAANPADCLKSLGLTRYEALVYIALLKVEGATASEIHEISGVPRASVYPVLDRLETRNLVSVSHTTPRRFNATPPEEGIGYLLRTINDDADRAKAALIEIYNQRTATEPGTGELIWSVYGEEKIRDRLSELLLSAQHEVLIIGKSTFLLKGQIPSLLGKLDSSVRIEITSDIWNDSFPREVVVHTFPKPPADIFKDKLEKLERHDMAGIVLIDGHTVMVVLGGGDFVPTAMYSESQGFYRFFRQYYNLMISFVVEAD